MHIVVSIFREKSRAILRRIYRWCHSPEEALRGEIEIASTTWHVEIAMTPLRRYIGLGGRNELAEKTGMLFIYPKEAIREFSMRNCLIPLDIIFFSSSLEVVCTYTMSVESDRAGRTKYFPPVPAQYILEIPAGECCSAGIVVGSKASFSDNIPSAVWSAP